MEQEPLSRRERRQMERSEQRSSAVRSNRGRRIVLWGGVLLGLAGLVWLMIRAAGTIPSASNGTLATPVSVSDNIFGPASASFTLVEYGDFQCPACAVFHPLVTRLFSEPELQGDLQFIFRHFPLTQIHTNAQPAAQAAQAAGIQGKFFEMTATIYEHQSVWEKLPTSNARDTFLQYARELGLNTEQLGRDMDSSAVKDKIKNDIASGNASGVNATPTFFINGVKLASPPSYEAFKQAILNATTITP